MPCRTGTAAADNRPLAVNPGGMLFAIEGPNGIGKSTAVAGLAERLRGLGFGVHATTEPTSTPLGRLIRSSEAELSGRALALAVAADRAAHLANEIIPALDAEQVVVCDRYVPSSLVLQRIDGLPLEEVWGYNSFAVPATLTLNLVDSPEAIRERLEARGPLSRLELVGTAQRELDLYTEAMMFLAGHGWKHLDINCRDQSPAGVVDRMVQAVTDAASETV